MLCNECKPTNIFLSTGKMNEQTVDFIEEWVNNDNNAIKVLVGHFPLKYKYGLGGARHRLYGHKKVAKFLNEKKLALSLCGHIHTGYSEVDKKGYGEICAGSLTRFGSIAEIVINESSGEFSHKFIKL
jgi:Icc-related predicted phosphoesterase